MQLLKARVFFFFFLEQSVIEKNNACQRQKKSGESHLPVPVTTSPFPIWVRRLFAPADAPASRRQSVLLSAVTVDGAAGLLLCSASGRGFVQSLFPDIIWVTVFAFSTLTCPQPTTASLSRSLRTQYLWIGKTKKWNQELTNISSVKALVRKGLKFASLQPVLRGAGGG